jgi:hypothetical protein
MSDFATLTTGPVLCSHCQEAVANVFVAYGDDIAMNQHRTLFATTFRSICEGDLQYLAEELRDALRATTCHRVRLVLTPEIAPIVSLDAVPYTDEENAAVQAQQDAARENIINVRRIVEAHRYAVLAEANREEPRGRIPLDDFLGG